MTKDELLIRLNQLSTYDFYAKNSLFHLLDKLIRGTSEDDVDFKAALKDNMVEPIIDLMLDCYTPAEALEWLSKNDFDLFIHYSDAETYSADELTEEEKEDCFLWNPEETIFVRSW